MCDQLELQKKKLNSHKMIDGYAASIGASIKSEVSSLYCSHGLNYLLLGLQVGIPVLLPFVKGSIEFRRKVAIFPNSFFFGPI